MGFTGQQYDPESGLSYNRFRYYNPVTASYTSSDPLGVGPNPGSATAYVHNPLTYVDPLGLKIHFKGKGGAKPGNIGARGEALVRQKHDIGKREEYSIGGRDRVSDGSTDYAVHEVKNVKYQHLSRQMKDGIQHSANTGRQYTFVDEV